jgi:hypothetical protein
MIMMKQLLEENFEFVHESVFMFLVSSDRCAFFFIPKVFLMNEKTLVMLKLWRSEI